MSVIGLCLWVVAAWLLQLALGGRAIWAAAYGLALAGLPLLVWLLVERGAPLAVAGLLVMALVLRWPLCRAVGRVLR